MGPVVQYPVTSEQEAVALPRQAFMVSPPAFSASLITYPAHLLVPIGRIWLQTSHCTGEKNKICEDQKASFTEFMIFQSAVDGCLMMCL